jgi:hypothetical protein
MVKSEEDRAEVRRKALKRFMALHGIESVNAWATAAGVRESTVREFLNGRSNSLNLLTYERLAEAKGSSLAEILGLDLPQGVTRGMGATHKVSRRRNGLEGGHKTVTAPESSAGADLLSLTGDGHDVSEPIMVSEIDVRAGAGLGGEAPLEVFSPDGRNAVSRDLARGEWGFPAEYLSRELRVAGGNARVIEVTGDSMQPTLNSGDRVLIDLADTRPADGIFAVWNGFGVVIKRVEPILTTNPLRIRLISDNPRHSPQELTLDEIRIIGRAAWFGRRL